MALMVSVCCLSTAIRCQEDQVSDEGEGNSDLIVQRKMKALKKLFFNRERKVPIIYNRESKLFQKYLRNRLLRGRDEGEEGDHDIATNSSVSLQSVELPRYAELYNEVDDLALLAPESSEEDYDELIAKHPDLKRLNDSLGVVDQDGPGKSLKEQLENLEEEQVGNDEANRDLYQGKGYLDWYNKPQQNSLKGVFVREAKIPFREELASFQEFGHSLPVKSFFEEDDTTVTVTEASALKPESSTFDPYRIAPEPTNVHNVNGVLFRKPLLPFPEHLLGTVPKYQHKQLSSAHHHQPLTKEANFQNIKAVPAVPDIFNPGHPLPAPTPTLFRQALGTTQAPVVRDKNIRFDEKTQPSLKVEIAVPDAKHHALHSSLHPPPPDTTPHAPIVALPPHPPQPPKATTPLPSPQETKKRPAVEHKDSFDLGKTAPPSGIYYKPVDPSEATTSAPYYKPFVPEEKDKLQGQSAKPHHHHDHADGHGYSVGNSYSLRPNDEDQQQSSSSVGNSYSVHAKKEKKGKALDLDNLPSPSIANYQYQHPPPQPSYQKPYGIVTYGDYGNSFYDISQATPHPLIYGFHPVKFEETRPSADTLYHLSRPVRFPL